MKRVSIVVLALVMVVGAALPAFAQAGASPQGPAKFAPPTRIKAGDAWLGAERLYPSPVLQDINGDRVPDVVVGDLRGKVSVALGQRIDDGGLVLAEEAPLKDQRGKQLEFHNW